MQYDFFQAPHFRNTALSVYITNNVTTMFADIEPFLQVTGATLNGANFDTHRQNKKKMIAEHRPT